MNIINFVFYYWFIKYKYIKSWVSSWFFDKISIFFFHLVVALQLEDTFNHLNFCCCGFHSAEGSPIVHDQTCPNNVRSSVYGSCTEWDLQQVRELVKLFDCSLRMDETSVVADDTVGSNEHIVGHWVSEDFDTESISNNFFSLLIQIGVN